MLKGWKFQSWFGNLKTLWKLILGFAAVAMVMFVVGLAGLLGLQQVRDQLRIVYENSTLALVNVGESSTNLGLYHDALLNAGRTTKLENFQHALKPLAAYKRQTLAPLAALAETTSVVTLAGFALANLALVRVKRRDPHPEGATVFPIWIPMLGAGVSLAFVLYELGRALS